MVPVIGEAVPMPFMEQIELDEWHWDLKYDEKANDGKGGTTSPTAEAESTKPAFKGAELIREVQKMQTNNAYQQDIRNKKVMELIKKAVADVDKAAEKGAAEDTAGTGAAASADGDDSGADNKMTFTFKKNVDLATTQLLNSMKAGERMPRAIVTLHHRSPNVPVTLVVTFGTIVLTKYELSVDPTDTMADMKESWTATYETVDYVYKNRPAASGPNGVTQGTARVFKMKLKNLF